MLSQCVFAKIVLEVSPQSMGVIGSVLSIVVLKNECWTLDAKIVWFAGLNLPRPSEVDLIKSRLLDFFTVGIRDLASKSIEVLIQ